jgi:hypothetical protein
MKTSSMGQYFLRMRMRLRSCEEVLIIYACTSFGEIVINVVLSASDLP